MFTWFKILKITKGCTINFPSTTTPVFQAINMVVCGGGDGMCVISQIYMMHIQAYTLYSTAPFFVQIVAYSTYCSASGLTHIHR